MSTDVEAYAIIQDRILVGAIYAEILEKGYVEVSYFIGKKFQRRGYATQALKLIERILIENLQVHKIKFAINPNNVASINTAIKFGANFCKSGVCLDYYEKVIT